MLSDYRTWLESELKLLGNASHHAYSFGQANMAKRAIERLDQELANKIPLLLTPAKKPPPPPPPWPKCKPPPRFPQRLNSLRKKLEAATKEASAGT